MKTPACFECGSVATENHHVVPKSLGGTKTIPLCAKCHSIVHGRKTLETAALAKAALKAKRARGEYTGGSEPFGYSVKDQGGVKTLIPNPVEQKTIAKIMDLRSSGVTFRAIVKQLNDERANNKRWHIGTIQQVIKNHAGVKRFNVSV